MMIIAQVKEITLLQQQKRQQHFLRKNPHQLPALFSVTALKIAWKLTKY